MVMWDTNASGLQMESIGELIHYRHNFFVSLILFQNWMENFKSNFFKYLVNVGYVFRMLMSVNHFGAQ